MKTKILYTVLALLAVHLAAAQILWSENFDNLTLGNVGTDHTGNTPGQGDWHTLSQSSEIPSENSNDYFKIVSEPGRGKVLELAATPGKGRTFLQKRGIDALWNTRTPGNDVLKIEIDFYTGDQFSDGGTGLPTPGALLVLKPNETFDATSNDVIGNFGYYPNQEIFTLYGIKNCSYNTGIVTSLKLKTWVKVIFYLDFSSQKYYTLIPANNAIYSCTLDSTTKVTSFLLRSSNAIGSQAIIPKYKYDNFIISAVDTVPLSVEEWVSSKFNVFPNPAKDVITITNSENIGIEELTVYDINGKVVKLQKSNNENEIQLNIESFATGNYLLHIKTKEETAVKKIIKK